MSTRRKATQAAFGQFSNLFLASVAAVISSRWLGPEGRGILSMSTAAGFLGATCLSLGLGTGISTLVARREMSVLTAFKVSITGVTLVGSMALLASLLFRGHVPVDWPRILEWFPAIVVAVLLSLLQTNVAVGAGRFDASIANTTTTGLLMITGYVVAAGYVQATSLTAIAIWIAAQSAGAIVGWALLLRTSDTRTALRPVLRDLVSLSLAAFPGALLGIANSRLDVLLLGLWSTPNEVGWYSTAALGVSALAIFPTALGQALANRYGANGSKPSYLLRRGLMVGFGLAVVLGAVAAFAARPLIALLFGPEFEPASGMFVAMVPGYALFSTVYVSVSYVNVVLRRPWINGRVVGVSLLVDLVLFVLLVPVLGGMGAAIASSAAYAVGAIFNLAQLRPELQKGGSRGRVTPISTVESGR